MITLPVKPAQIIHAVAVIRAQRGVKPDDGFPHDLGCETQLVLGVALVRAFPWMGMTALATLCRVHVPDALFFAELCALAAPRLEKKHMALLRAAEGALKAPAATSLAPVPRRAAG